MSSHDDASKALFWPFQTGALTLAAAPALFLGARLNPDLFAFPQVEWRCEQAFLPFASALLAAGIEVSPHVNANGFEWTLILPSRQRDEARALLARGVAATADGGHVVAAAANLGGGRALESDLQRLTGNVQGTAKHKCRIAWSRIDPETLDTATLEAWLALDTPRQVDAGGESFWSRPGLFAWDRIDVASMLLAEQLPTALSGRVADLGAGWGYLSMQLLRRCPGISTLELFEANARALEPAQRNLVHALAGRTTPNCSVHWHDVTRGLPGKFDAIVSNPPFHLDRSERPELGRAFIARAADALSDHGQFWLVANRHLPYEDALAQRFGAVQTVVQKHGFKVICAREPRP